MSGAAGGNAAGSGKRGYNPVKTIFLVAFCSWLSLFTAPIARAETVFVAPGGAESANGSSDAPWASVRDALASGRVNGGDTIRLAKGRYGRLELRGFRFSKPVSIVAADDSVRNARVLELFGFEGLERKKIPTASAGGGEKSTTRTSAANGTINT